MFSSSLITNLNESEPERKPQAATSYCAGLSDTFRFLNLRLPKLSLARASRLRTARKQTGHAEQVYLRQQGPSHLSWGSKLVRVWDFGGMWRAYAQQAQESDRQVEKVFITGSNIKTIDSESVTARAGRNRLDTLKQCESVGQPLRN